jgi:ankyrin repeat protein
MNKLIKFAILLVLLTSCGKRIEEDHKANTSDTNSDTPGEVLNDQQKLKRSQLYDALYSNDTNLVETALIKFKEIHFRFKTNGETPLTMAIKSTKTEIINKVIEKTTNLNQTNLKGEFPIELAIEKENNFVLNALILKNVDLNIISSQKTSLLIQAIKKDNEDMAIKLITFGANTEGSYNIAQQKNFTKLTRLIELVQTHKEVQLSTLITAIETGNIYFISYLLNNFKQYKKLIDQENLLLMAIEYPEFETRHLIIQTLLRHKININNQYKSTPLIKATKINDTVLIRKLLGNKANPTLKDEEDRSALYYAVENLNQKAVLVLKRAILEYSEIQEPDFDIDSLLRNSCKKLPALNEVEQHQRWFQRNIYSALECKNYNTVL